MSKAFLIDEQTQKDIQLRDFTNRTILSFFDQTATDGGQDFLNRIFYDPLTDVEQIRNRQHQILRLYPVVHEPFPFYRVILKDIEKFVKSSHSGVHASLSLLDFFGIQSPVYYYKKRNIQETVDFVIKAQEFYQKINRVESYPDIAEMLQHMDQFLKRVFKQAAYNVDKLKITIFNIETYERMIRFEFAGRIKELIKFFYEIDAYMAVARVAKAHDFCLPEVYPKNQTQRVSMQGLYHIFHRKPVRNDLELNQDKKLWFLTGANMAGKSSIIKSISVAIYLTHIGFPVPATELKTDVMDGLFTSVNLQDNLELGYSHFYMEAIRLKEIIDQIEPESNALIILDELFKGTNHADASQAIYKVMKSLDSINGPYAIVSSHITELSEELKSLPSVDFFKMKIDTDSEGLPVFTYKIMKGIAEERLGMWLLGKSGVFESLERLKPPISSKA